MTAILLVFVLSLRLVLSIPLAAAAPEKRHCRAAILNGCRDVGSNHQGILWVDFDLENAKLLKQLVKTGVIRLKSGRFTHGNTVRIDNSCLMVFTSGVNTHHHFTGVVVASLGMQSLASLGREKMLLSTRNIYCKALSKLLTSVALMIS